MARKIIVQSPYGTFTKHSDRPYQFVIIGFGELESVTQRKRLAERRKEESNAQKYGAVVASGKIPPEYPQDWKMEDTYEKWLSEARERLATLDARYDERLRAAREAVAEQRGEALAWSQSTEGAERARNKYARTYTNVLIIPVAPAVVA